MSAPPADPDPRDVEASSALEADAPIEQLAVQEAEALPDARGRIRSGKLAGLSMGRAIWVLAVPVLLQQMMTAFVGMTDKVFAGQLAEGVRLPALDAIGIGSYVGWFTGIAMSGLGIGGQVLIARGVGGGDLRLAHRALGQAMSLSLLWGTAVGVLLWFGSPPVAVACRLSPEATALFLDYLRTLACSMPLAGVMMVGAMCLYGAGETTKPALIAIGVNVVNVLFSWALSGADLRYGPLEAPHVLENPFSFDLLVQGIALGTAISYLFGAAITMVVLRRGVKDLRLEGGALALEASMVRRIVRVGAPNFMEGISMWAVNLIVLVFIGMISANGGGGEGLQGAHIIAVQWESFSFLPGFAIGTAAGALAGQYLGAGDPGAARRAIVVCTGIAVVVMGSLGVVFMLFGRELTLLISSEPIHLENTPKLLFIGGMTQVFFGIAMVVRQGLRGVGDARWTLFITTVSSYGLRMPLVWLLGVHLGLGLQGIWIGLCSEFIVRAALFVARFVNGGWERVVV